MQSRKKNFAKTVAKPRTVRYTEGMMSDDDVHLWPELSAMSWVVTWTLVAIAVLLFILLVPPHPLWTEPVEHMAPLPASEVTTIAPVFETP